MIKRLSVGVGVGNGEAPTWELAAKPREEAEALIPPRFTSASFDCRSPNCRSCATVPETISKRIADEIVSTTTAETDDIFFITASFALNQKWFATWQKIVTPEVEEEPRNLAFTEGRDKVRVCDC